MRHRFGAVWSIDDGSLTARVTARAPDGTKGDFRIAWSVREIHAEATLTGEVAGRALSALMPARSSEELPLPRRRPRLGQNSVMASYTVNERAVAHARRLIKGRQYVLRSEWGDVQPGADDENAFLASHSWDEYGEWHLGLTEGAADETKARYAFVYGDFRRIHRSGLIACQYRAAEWRHKDVELAAHRLLQLLDKTST
jgi:hypothetical protein